MIAQVLLKAMLFQQLKALVRVPPALPLAVNEY